MQWHQFVPISIPFPCRLKLRALKSSELKIKKDDQQANRPFLVKY